jgi:hypothetical protein
MNRLASRFAVLLLSACGGRTDPTPDPNPAAPSTPSAHVAGDDDDVAAVLVPSGLRLVGHDGTVRTVLDGDPPSGGATASHVYAAGRFVLAVVTRDLSDAAPEELGTLATADGAVLWKQSFPYPNWVEGAELGLDGSLARTTDTGTSVLGADGAAIDLAGFKPIGAATVDSFLPVGPLLAKLEADNATLQPTDAGWWKIGSPAPVPLAFAPAQAPVAFGRALLYARADAPDHSLVIQTPEDAHALDIPFAINWPPSPYAQGGGRWVLISDSDPMSEAVWRVDVTTGQADRHVLSLPDGFRPLSACSTAARAASVVSASPDGRMIATLRTDDRAAAFASSDGAAWSPLGEPVTAIASFGVRFCGDTFALLASSTIPCYTPVPTWTAATVPALVPEATQVLRPSQGTALVRTGPGADGLFTAPYSSSGRYAALWDTPDATGARWLHILDVATGADVRALFDPTGRAPAPAWVSRTRMM